MNIAENDNSEKIVTHFITDIESKRISILKVWLTIMVVFIHSYSENINLNSGNIGLKVPIWLDFFKYTISQVISKCAVPAFFFISAFFLYRKKYSFKENIRKKYHTLVVPYFILNTFWIAFFMVCQHVPFLGDYFANPDNIISNWKYTDWLGAYLGTPKNPYPLLYPLWFLRDLFILNLLANVFLKFVDKFKKLSALCFLILWLFCASTHIFFLDIQSICFWGFGCWFVKNKRLSIVEDFNSVFICILYISLIICDIISRNIGGIFHMVVARLCIIFGIIFFYKFTTIINNNIVQKYLLKISQYSFAIYIFHEMNLTILKKICVKVFPTSPIFQLLEYILIPCTIIIFCLILSANLEKKFPKLYCTITGGRSK